MNEDRNEREAPRDAAPAQPGPVAVDPRRASEVALWRKSERKRLRDERAALSVADRKEIAAALAEGLNRLIADRMGSVAGRVVSGYWPIKGEPDLRFWLTEMGAAGAVTALPVVETKAAPLVFRRWNQESRMVRGDWGIPVPSPESEVVTPEIVLAPLVGWDGAGYRLGYGGGYFDRTLGSLSPRPFAIGVGLHAAQLATIHPQPHDVPLDAILTEAGAQFVREG